MKDTLGKFLQEVKRHLEYQQSIGTGNCPASEEIRGFMATVDRFVQERDEKRSSTPLLIGATVEARVQTGREKAVAPQNTLEDIRLELGDCTRCSLHKNRTRIVFGVGNPKARLVILGEWPNSRDDAEGRLFSGDEGELLEKMLKAIGLDMEDVYLGSIVKCRASEEHPPGPENVRACLPFLLNQIDVIAPAVICTMGPQAAQAMLNTNKLLVRLRGRVHTYKNIPLVPTFHPSYLLKNPEMKKAAWYDLQLIQQILSKQR